MLRHLSHSVGMHFIDRLYEKQLKPPFRRFYDAIHFTLEKKQVGQRLRNSFLSWEHCLLLGALVIIFGIVLLGAKIYQNNQLNQLANLRMDQSRQLLYETDQMTAYLKDMDLMLSDRILSGDKSGTYSL